MSKIDDQIKELELRKKKISFYYAVKAFVVNNKDFPETKKSVESQVVKFIATQIEAIENNATEDLSKTAFNKAEVKVLKDMAERVVSRTSSSTLTDTNKQLSQKPQISKSPPNNNMPQQDKLSFALANRHLDSKKVQVITENGNVSGTVCGLDAPNVVVKTDTGYTVEVPLDKIIV